jgi:proliferating cell nuclear antigen
MAKGSQIGFGEDYEGCPYAQQNECPKEIMEACRKAYWEAEIPVPQFSMTFESAIQARLLFSAVKALSEEASLELMPEGARIKVMDPSHVAMVDLWMPSFSFYEYGFSGEKPVRLPIAFEDLLKAFPRIDKETRLRIFPPAPVRKRKERDRIVLSFEGKLRKALEIELLDGEEISEERIPELNLKFQVEARLCVEDFLEVVRDAKKVASYLRIEATRDSLTLSAAGDSKKLRVPLTIADRLLSLEVSPEASEVKATYRLEYLEAALEALRPLTETVKVEFSKDYPIRIGEVLPNGIEVSYAIAPVVE